MKIGAIPPGYEKNIKMKQDKVLNEKTYNKYQDGGKFAVLSPDDQLSISFLQDETDKNYTRLKDIVEDMLRRQGVEVENLAHLKDEDVDGLVIDEQAQSEAAQMIGPDGPLSPENTAERIFQFAKSISGGDTDKYDKLKEAIIGGFDAAKEMLGGELPEISQKTYDLVMEKMDDWAGIERPEEVEGEETVPVEVPEEPAEPVEVPEEPAFVLPEQEESIVTQMLDAEVEVEEEEGSLLEQMLPEEIEEE